MKQSLQHTLGRAARALAAVAAIGLLPAQAMAQSASAEGEIRKVDAKAGRVIIRHGDWKGMDMQAMTMAFRVRDAAILQGFKPEDRVLFTIEKDGRDYIVTAIERSVGAQASAAAGGHDHSHHSHDARR